MRIIRKIEMEMGNGKWKTFEFFLLRFLLPAILAHVTTISGFFSNNLTRGTVERFEYEQTCAKTGSMTYFFFEVGKSLFRACEKKDENSKRRNIRVFFFPFPASRDSRP